MRMKILLVLVFLLAGVLSAALSAPKRSSSAITVTADGMLLLCVNPDSNSVTLVDTASASVVAEIPVGTDPRTVAVDDAGQRAYVANRGDSSLSVLDIPARETIAQVQTGLRPYGVVVSPDGRWVYVAAQGTDRLAVLDTASLEIVSTIALPDRPSGLAISQEGSTIWVTHLLANTISILHVLPNDAPISHSVVSEISLWPDSNLVQSVVLSHDGTRGYVPHTRSNTSNRRLTFDTTVFPLVSLVDLTTQRHLVGQQIALGTLDPPGVGLPFDAAVTLDNTELWVVNAGSNDVSVIDLRSGQRIAHIEVGDNPRGIVLSPDGRRAYVNNTLAGTVSIIDTASYEVAETLKVTAIPLPPVLLHGKRLFHSSDDPRLSRGQWISCNTCHFEGEHDGRTWHFRFAGPRNTTSLLGMIETYPLRWSGEWDESADSEFAIRRENFGTGLIEGPMHCDLSPPDCGHQLPNQGRSYDLDCLALFIDSLEMPLSPTAMNRQPLTDSEVRGQALFHDAELGCAGCHPPPLYTDLQKHDVGTATPDERIGAAYDTPSLRGIHDSGPYFHDGSALTLRDTLCRPTPGSEHDVTDHLDEPQIRDLIAFLQALPFER